MPGVKKSLRPKARPKHDEGSTQHPSGKNMDQRTQGKGAGTRHPSGKNIYEQDTQTFRRGGKVKTSKTPDMPKDPEAPSKVGTKKGGFMLPYKRTMGKKLGTDKMRVGPPNFDGDKPPMGSKGTRKNFHKTFMDGGEVRVGDVRDNPKRGKCY